MQQGNSHVFLSRASADSVESAAIAAALVATGFNVKSDEDIMGGDDYRRKIKSYIESAAAVVVVWSRQSVESQWVRAEARVANAHGVYVPVRVETCEIPLGLDEVQVVDMRGWDCSPDHAGFRQLLRSLTSPGETGISPSPATLPPTKPTRWFPGKAAALLVLVLLLFGLPFLPRWTKEQVSGGDDVTPPRTAWLDSWEILDATEIEGHPRSVKDPRTEITFMLVPSGSFIMGAPAIEETFDDRQLPAHIVTIESPFYLARTEVTERQWARFAMHSEKHAGNMDADEEAAELPKTRVSWFDASEYCEHFGYELPSEAQWEYACRGGTETPYWKGSEEADLDAVGFYDANSENRPHVVASKNAPNPFGLHDLHGNVREWCRDIWHRTYAGAPQDGSARLDGISDDRPVRGGAFADSARRNRTYYRLNWTSWKRDHRIGFRPAMRLGM